MRNLALTAAAMIAFAANSVFCRFALRETDLDAATFTATRIAAGALMLAVILTLRRGAGTPRGSWVSAAALFAYAAAFSFAYRSLPTGSGALLLFGAVQATMISYGLWKGERFSARQTIGFLAAIAGLVALVLPGVTAPSPRDAALMLAAGVAWGVYSLRGRGEKDPLATTAGNFLRATPLAIGCAAVMLDAVRFDRNGMILAVVSGAIASGCGYVIWYGALRSLKATHAATVHLSVPPLAALGGILFRGEMVTFRLGISSPAILGGIALVVRRP